MYKKILSLIFSLIFLSFTGMTQGNQFYVIEKVYSQRNVQKWECSGYLEIKDSVATFVYKYRNEMNGIYGEIDGYNKKDSVQKFYIRGRGISGGSLISFVIRNDKDNAVVIRSYSKLSHFSLFFNSQKILKKVK